MPSTYVECTLYILIEDQSNLEYFTLFISDTMSYLKEILDVDLSQFSSFKALRETLKKILTKHVNIGELTMLPSDLLVYIDELLLLVSLQLIRGELLCSIYERLSEQLSEESRLLDFIDEINIFVDEYLSVNYIKVEPDPADTDPKESDTHLYFNNKDGNSAGNKKSEGPDNFFKDPNNDVSKDRRPLDPESIHLDMNADNYSDSELEPELQGGAALNSGPMRKLRCRKGSSIKTAEEVAGPKQCQQCPSIVKNSKQLSKLSIITRFCIIYFYL